MSFEIAVKSPAILIEKQYTVPFAPIIMKMA